MESTQVVFKDSFTWTAGVIEYKYNQTEKPKTDMDKQYLVVDKTKFFASGITASELPSAAYQTIWDDRYRCGLQRMEIEKCEWIKIENNIIDFILNDFSLFWNKESAFKKSKQIFKRGCLLYGAQGCGKTQLIGKMRDSIIDRGGVVIYVNSPSALTEILGYLRTIEPKRYLMVVMEDIDDLFAKYSETEILQVLDGFSTTHKVYFIATTNYPEKLKDRITNRPNRFDIVAEIPLPDDVARKSFVSAKIRQYNSKEDLDKYVKLTSGMSFAHINELFTSTEIMGYDLQETLDRINNMKYPRRTIKTELGFSFNSKQ